MLYNELLMEDLKAGDLEDLVSRTIEIDTYKPKINDKNIVVAFFVSEEDPAYDLNRFIEFSNKNILDTEVSQAPNAKGEYVVFVEFSQSDLAKKIYEMLKAVSYLTGNTEWVFKAYGKKGKLKVD